MSAPSIPNLNSLRRGGPRLRGSSGRGRGGTTTSASNNDSTSDQRLVTNAPSHSAIKDRIIRATDNDAATSRLSAVACGYLSDPFAGLLHADSKPSRRLPLMNRGTYVRTTAIDRIVDTFLSIHHGQRVQIISLGAGSDTRYFRLHSKSRTQQPDLLYHEFDLPENVQTKIARMQRPDFTDTLHRETHLNWPNPLLTTSDSEAARHFTQGQYSVRALDLRTLPSSPTSPSLEATSSIDSTLPTLLISECCLCYLSPLEADAALSFFTSLIPPPAPLAAVIYEPIRPFDAFGRTMTQNLAGRGISLPTVEAYADLGAQRARLAAHGFKDGAAAADIDAVWRSWVAEQECERVEALEWMDEVEEFVLLARHYVVAWGWRGYRREGAGVHHDNDGNDDGDAVRGGHDAWSSLPAPDT